MFYFFVANCVVPHHHHLLRYSHLSENLIAYYSFKAEHVEFFMLLLLFFPSDVIGVFSLLKTNVFPISPAGGAKETHFPILHMSSLS